MNEIRQVSENQEERFQGDSLVIITLKGGTFDDVQAKLQTRQMAPLVDPANKIKGRHDVFMILNKLAYDSKERDIKKYDEHNTALKKAGIHRITPVVKASARKSDVQTLRDQDASSGLHKAIHSPNQHVIRIESAGHGRQKYSGGAADLTDQNMAALQVELEDRLDILGLEDITVKCSLVDLSLQGALHNIPDV